MTSLRLRLAVSQSGPTKTATTGEPLTVPAERYCSMTSLLERETPVERLGFVISLSRHDWLYPSIAFHTAHIHARNERLEREIRKPYVCDPTWDDS
jgi:hypothetical protein